MAAAVGSSVAVQRAQPAVGSNAGRAAIARAAPLRRSAAAGEGTQFTRCSAGSSTIAGAVEFLAWPLSRPLSFSGAVRAAPRSLVVSAAQKREMMMWEALREGLDEEMERDPTVCLMGALAATVLRFRRRAGFHFPCASVFWLQGRVTVASVGTSSPVCTGLDCSEPAPAWPVPASPRQLVATSRLQTGQMPLQPSARCKTFQSCALRGCLACASRCRAPLSPHVVHPPSSRRARLQARMWATTAAPTRCPTACTRSTARCGCWTRPSARTASWAWVGPAVGADVDLVRAAGRCGKMARMRGAGKAVRPGTCHVACSLPCSASHAPALLLPVDKIDACHNVFLQVVGCRPDPRRRGRRHDRPAPHRGGHEHGLPAAGLQPDLQQLRHAALHQRRAVQGARTSGGAQVALRHSRSSNGSESLLRWLGRCPAAGQLPGLPMRPRGTPCLRGRCLGAASLAAPRA